MRTPPPPAHGIFFAPRRKRIKKERGGEVGGGVQTRLQKMTLHFYYPLGVFVHLDDAGVASFRHAPQRATGRDERLGDGGALESTCRKRRAARRAPEAGAAARDALKAQHADLLASRPLPPLHTHTYTHTHTPSLTSAPPPPSNPPPCSCTASYARPPTLSTAPQSPSPAPSP